MSSPRRVPRVVLPRLLFTALTVAPAWLVGQSAGPPADTVADRVEVIPGPDYGASGLFTWLLGAGYRDLWTTPIEVEVADLSSLGGGLTPMRLGGGATTLTLHLRGNDGRRYVFRSVDKSPSRYLPPELRGTPVEAVLQDQISAFLPTGAPVVAALLDAVDVLHATPRFLVVPDDPRLGEFRERFAGTLVLFEERPDEGIDDAPGFAGSRRVVSTETMFDELEEDPGARVDARALLRARLVDLLVGDRDRSNNNILWARFDEEDGHVFQPVPRDRDQAFIRLDGVVKAMVRPYDPRMVVFDDEYPSIVGLTQNAWDVDRQILVSLDRSAWDETVAEVRQRLTDAVIDGAVGRLPDAHFRILGPSLAEDLRRRRDTLDEAAEALYEIVFRYADVRATDEDEIAVVEIGEGGWVEVDIREEGSRSGPHFTRAFDPAETREIRVYLRGGRDQAEVRGEDTPITLRIIGGGGADRLTDARSPGSEGAVHLYDGGDRTTFEAGGRARVHERSPTPPTVWQDGSVNRDWGRVWRPAPAVTFNRDLGLMVAVGAERYGYAFDKEPLSSRLGLQAGYATRPGRFFVDYRHELRDVPRGVDPSLHVRWSGIEVLHFHGFGNETAAPRPSEFYRVDQRQLLVEAGLGFGRGGPWEMTVGPIFKVSSTDTLPAGSTFLTESRPYGSGASFRQAGLALEVAVDRRNRTVAATRGVLVRIGGSAYPEILDVDRGTFGEAHGSVAAYLSPSEDAGQTLALRIGGKRVWGTAPFHDAAFLGGSETIRGFREERFAGESAAWGNAELRVRLGSFFFLFPSRFGVLALGDVGRVWSDGEESGRWHSAVGGGLWLAPVYADNTVQISVARSAEHTGVYVGAGLFF